jgi:hypothetical protein
MKTILFFLLIACTSFANAGFITFDLNYSGAQFQNSALATGSITFDDTILPQSGLLVFAKSSELGVIDFSLTVSGANSGNGTFGLSDVTNWVWSLKAPLNLSQELMGQAGFDDFNWCISSDFDGCKAPAPGGVDRFQIQTDAKTDDYLVLTSMKPAQVSEPASLALFALGLIGLSMVRRKTV